MKVKFLSEEKAVAPGQACVIYDGTRVLGGGWITRDVNCHPVACPRDPVKNT